MTYDPWRDAAERHPDVVIRRTDCLPAFGAWIEAARVILVEQSLERPARNSVLAHEVAHLDLGHRMTGDGWFDRRQERQADRLAARRLVTFEALADALTWALTEDEIADYLHVTPDVVRLRFADLTARELAALDALLYDESA